MIEVENAQLLASQESLQKLSSKPLSGLHALRLGDILEAADTRLQRLQEVRQGLMEEVEAGEKEHAEVDEEWAEVLEDSLEVEKEPLPREAFESIEISAQTLMALDWLIVE
jgi:hypothetical protein